MLMAMASLEAEHDSQGGGFYVWAIVDRVYALSPEMQDRHRRTTGAIEARNVAIRERAAAGDGKAALYLSLGRSLACGRRSPRWRRTAPEWLTETALNPSRVLASLQRRGLVSRVALNGGGSAGLTDTGRQIAAELSVGSTWRPLTAGEMTDA
ncbi:hypothetical protein [Methylobacterium trifolii]|uniref:MarR family transcriptional regulator n=1 Tax=Methylobacterium trifolii TaxID=1003092 RepID=A0ABQ4TVA4_9HYPH|nr:hypothetical protein [Methylobacterium trifolii]GJE59218.1 hypothetical protein MPOCJGCO_1306 [Methylobacterium trifolii]